MFGMCKTAVDRLARDMAIELDAYDVCAVSLWQALTITERVQQSVARNATQSRANTAVFGEGSTVEHPGRVVAALAADPDRMRHSGATYITAELAQHYGVTDVDGRVIPSLRETRGEPIFTAIRAPREAV
jgi:hypothetical protein